VNATDDRELERYLQGGDSLTRAYAELKSERPTPALDQAVLAQAKAALRPNSHARGGRHFGWPALTAIAATVLLSFTLVMRVVLESETPHESPLSAPAASAPGTIDAAAPAALEDYAPPSTESDRSFAPPPASPVAGSSIEKSRSVIEAEIRAASESGPTVDESNAQEAAASSLETNRAAAPKLNGAHGVTAEPARPVARERVDAYSRAPVSDGHAQPAAAAAAGPEPQQSLVSAESLAKKEQPRPPQEWLAEIERLRASGDIEMADRELERFRQAYPGYLESQASPADR